MNTYRKYYPNVYLAKTKKEYNKGDEITMTTRHNQQHTCIVHNFIYSDDGFNFYSITRADGFDTNERNRRKAERYEEWARSRERKSNEYYKASKEGHDFLVLAEPIKIGHHSEKRHRALIERNHNRMSKSIENRDKATEWQSKADYWATRTDIVNLSMPESLEYFEFKLEEAILHHADLKKNPEKRMHSFSLQYANKEVNKLKKQLEIAKRLWA